jgi:hypothetical protein
MQVVKEAKGDIDEVARRIFDKAIDAAGGLRRLIGHRNLTWLPSLAEAAYVLAMKEIGAMTARSIAEELGITEATVRNITSSDPQDVERRLKGELPEISDHIAGGLAKLAMAKVREEGFLD